MPNRTDDIFSEFGVTNPVPDKCVSLLKIFGSVHRKVQSWARISPHDIRILVGREPIVARNTYETIFYNIGFVFARALRFYPRLIEKNEDADLDYFPTVLVARDSRQTSKELFPCTCQGLEDAGAYIIDGEESTITAGLWYSVDRKVPFIMTTASHYPWRYSGSKLNWMGGYPPINESSVMDLFERGAKNEFGDGSLQNAAGKLIKKIDLVGLFASYIRKNSPLMEIKKFKIAYESFGGPAMREASLILANTNIELIDASKVDVTLDYQPGDVEGYQIPDVIDMITAPDPMVRTQLNRLRMVVLQYGCDFGVARDEDGDREYFIDHNGEIVGADIIFALAVKQLLKEKPNASVLYDRRSSRILKRLIEKYGGTSVVHKVGHAFIVHTMHHQKLDIGGEYSGHYYSRRLNGCEDPWLIFFLLLKYLTENNLNLEQAIDGLYQEFGRSWQSDEINFSRSNEETSDKIKSAIIKFVEDYAKKIGQSMDVNFEDGLTFDVGEGTRICWRPSYTENCNRLSIETDKSVEELVYLTQSFIDIAGQFDLHPKNFLNDNNFPRLVAKISSLKYTAAEIILRDVQP